MSINHWLILIITLPGQSGTPRMRVWRALKGQGAGILRDGVYVLPKSETTEAVLQAQVQTVEDAGGVAYLLRYATDESQQAAQLLALFDQSTAYAEWTEQVVALRDSLPGLDEPEARRQEAKLRREFEGIVAIDYFPGEPKAQAEAAAAQIADTINAHFSPDEPSAVSGQIEPESVHTYQGRCWATRKNLWVDRVASAWLIRRFIDPAARFVWLDGPGDCPDDAVGFDFDGAAFSHVGELVTFEVLVQSFGLAQDRALTKLGTLVHYLDVGGVPVAEAAGFVTMLAGAKRQSVDDDALLQDVGALLDHLYAAYDAELRDRSAPC